MSAKLLISLALFFKTKDKVAKIIAYYILMHQIMMYICNMYSRELLKGILKPIIFKLLSENDKMYGYEITQTVKKISGNKILIKEGSLYPALHTLTKEGFLKVESIPIGNRVRKYYRLTKSGKTQVEPVTNELLEFSATLQTLFQEKPILS